MTTTYERTRYTDNGKTLCIAASYGEPRRGQAKIDQLKFDVQYWDKEMKDAEAHLATLKVRNFFAVNAIECAKRARDFAIGELEDLGIKVEI